MMGVFDWEVFEVNPGKPYRKPFASCEKIKGDMIQCIRGSQCFAAGERFETCMRSVDVSWVPERCTELVKGYGACRRGLLNPMRRLRPPVYN